MGTYKTRDMVAVRDFEHAGRFYSAGQRVADLTPTDEAYLTAERGRHGPFVVLADQSRQVAPDRPVVAPTPPPPLPPADQPRRRGRPTNAELAARAAAEKTPEPPAPEPPPPTEPAGVDPLVTTTADMPTGPAAAD